MSNNWIYSWFDLTHNLESGMSSFEASYESGDGFDLSTSHLVVGAELGLTLFEARREYEKGELTINGPNVGLDVGLKTNGFSAMTEASVLWTEATYGPFYAALGLNLNTGIKLQDGLQIGLFGFGICLGVNGKWTIDTPFGSAGSTTTDHSVAHTESHTKPHHFHYHPQQHHRQPVLMLSN